MFDAIPAESIKMKARELYAKLEKDFDLAHCKDDWSEMDFNEFVSDNFKNRHMGLLVDNSKEINKVYTAVFPSAEVINKILAKGEKDAMLFVHHPMNWDINRTGGAQFDIDKELLRKLKENNISVYALHTPLDNFGKYSTCTQLALALGLKIKEPFYDYFGHQAGVIARTDSRSIDELVGRVEHALGHDVKLWEYGKTGKIRGQLVGVIGGGGLDVQALRELKARDINAFITGVTRKSSDFEPAVKAHNYAMANRINIIGGTHYSTEKFACIAMTDYFRLMGLRAEFVTDKPDFEDVDYGFKG